MTRYDRGRRRDLDRTIVVAAMLRRQLALRPHLTVYGALHTWEAGATITYRIDPDAKTYSISGAATGNVPKRRPQRLGPRPSVAPPADDDPDPGDRGDAWAGGFAENH